MAIQEFQSGTPQTLRNRTRGPPSPPCRELGVYAVKIGSLARTHRVLRIESTRSAYDFGPPQVTHCCRKVTIYDDTSPHVALCKATQIGGTTWAILRSLHACLCGLNVMYFFPTRTDVLDFSRSRVSPLLAENLFLARHMRDTDTAGLKRIGEAYLYLRGMPSSIGMKSVPADAIVFDEIDEATPDARALAKERLAHSDYKRLIELSNPSLPDNGIDVPFQASDQRHWTLKCPACGAWTAPDLEFPMKLNHEVRVLQARPDGTVYRACVQCRGELDLEAGEWVAAYPDRLIHGYRISQLFSSTVAPQEILEDYRTTRFPERFYNLKIGVPWADTENRVDRAGVIACCGDEPIIPKVAENVHCTMGVDIGKDIHVVISRRLGDAKAIRKIVYLGIHQEFGELDSLMERFRVTTCVIDAMPELRLSREFVTRQRGKAWLCYFNEHQKGEPKWDTKERIVQINRTEALDHSRAVLRERNRILPRLTPIVEQFAAHVQSNAKRLEEDPKTGEQRYVYTKTGPDHFSLAHTYDCLAAMRDFGGGYTCSGVSSGHPLTREQNIWILNF